MTGTVAQTAAAPIDGLIQYGAIGIVAALALYAVVKLFARTSAQADTAIAAERARADRLEKQLADLTTDVIGKFLPATLESNRVMGEVLAELRRDAGRGNRE